MDDFLKNLKAEEDGKDHVSLHYLHPAFSDVWVKYEPQHFKGGEAVTSDGCMTLLLSYKRSQGHAALVDRVKGRFGQDLPEEECGFPNHSKVAYQDEDGSWRVAEARGCENAAAAIKLINSTHALPTPLESLWFELKEDPGRFHIMYEETSFLARDVVRNGVGVFWGGKKTQETLATGQVQEKEKDGGQEKAQGRTIQALSQS